MALNREASRLHSRGFTLIEILVVMVVIGLMAGVALPRLYDVARRFEMSAQRDKLLLDIGNLGYRAYQSGQAMLLSAPDAAPLTIPPGWKIDIPQPIHYSFNGICGGGRLTLHNPDNVTEALTLKPPLCIPTSISNSPSL